MRTIRWFPRGAALLAVVSSAAAFNLQTIEPLRATPEDALAQFVQGASEFHLADPVKRTETRRLHNLPGQLPLHFEPLAPGSGVDGFVSRGNGYALFLAPGEAVLHLTGRRGAPPATVRLKFAGATAKRPLEAIDRLRAVSNYYRGSDASKWRVGVPHFGKVRQREIYPGIDVVFYGRGRELEYDLIVAPGADPDQIRIELEGVNNSSLDAGGNLIMETAAGALSMRRPFVYQEIDGERREIEGRFTFAAGAAPQRAGRTAAVAFQLAKYDRTRPLVIDPLFGFTGGFGGTMRDEAFGVAVGPGGNIYLAGRTSSIDFPVTGGGTQMPQLRGVDAWIAFLNGDGSDLIASTYFGGDEDDEALAIAADRFGIAYVTGYTQSGDFPVGGSLGLPFGGVGDAFVAAFDLTGRRLYSTYFGGSALDQGNGIAVDPAGAVYVSGWTRSTNLPVVNALQPANAGGTDAFVLKLDPRGSPLIYATYLGGNNHEYPGGVPLNNSSAPSGGIAADSAGNAYVTGSTLSTLFPTTANAYRTSGGGVYLSKINPLGTALSYSTTLGGGNGCAVAADDEGHALVTGVTFSSSFPIRLAAQATYRGSGDAFVARVNTLGSGDASLVSSTFLGETGYEAGYGVQFIRIAGVNHAVVAGTTNSTSFPGTSQPSGGSMLTSTDAGATWTKANKGIFSSAFSAGTVGKVTSIAVDPENPGVAYAGTQDGNVFKTATSGALWERMSDGLPEGLPIAGLGVDPENSANILAMTFSSGIYRYSGTKWEQRSGALPMTSEKSTFVFGEAGAIYVNAFQGVFGSTDGGTTWAARSNGLPEGVTSLSMDPSNTLRLLAGHFNGLYLSLNGGASWARHDGNLAALMGGAPSSAVYIVAALILNDVARTILALVGSNPDRVGGLAKSTDDGETYSWVLRTGDPDGVIDPVHGIPHYTGTTLATDPDDTSNILVGTGRSNTAESAGLGVLSTTDGGATWTSSGPIGTEVNAFALGLTAGGAQASAWYAATTGGDDGFIATVPLDGSAPATEIVGGTGDDELRSVAASEEFLTSTIGSTFIWAGGTASSIDITNNPEVLAPPPSSVPSGPVIPPVEPQNPLVVAQLTGPVKEAQADLSIRKTLRVGQSFGRTGVVCDIEVTNNSPDTTATNVQVGEFAVDFTSPVDTTHTGLPIGISGPEQNILTVDLGDIAPGGKKRIELFYPVYSSGGGDLGQTRFNLVQVAMPVGNDVIDPMFNNNIASAEVFIPETPPEPVPPQTANHSTRLLTGTGDRVAISGTIITAPPAGRSNRTVQGGGTKKVIFRAIGPSLQVDGTPVPGRLADPSMELFDHNGTRIGRNDNWRQTQIGGVITADQVAEIEASSVPPTHELESAIVAELAPGAYTAVIRGAGGATGISLAEVYDLDPAHFLRLANISTRGFVDTGDNVMIGGVLLRGDSTQEILVRAIGPSLAAAGVSGELLDPTLALHDGNGAVIAANDNWRSHQEADIIATTIPPSHDAEAAILASLTPGAYTAIVRGTESSTGVALVEVYNLGPEQPPPALRP